MNGFFLKQTLHLLKTVPFVEFLQNFGEFENSKIIIFIEGFFPSMQSACSKKKMVVFSNTDEKFLRFLFPRNDLSIEYSILLVLLILVIQFR